MELSKKDIKIIKAAVESRNRNRVLQAIFFALLILALIALFYGRLSSTEFTFLALPLIFLAIASPQFGGAPKYSDLVEILEKQLPQKKTTDEALMDELIKHKQQQTSDEHK